jgi:hypothetical protein
MSARNKIYQDWEMSYGKEKNEAKTIWGPEEIHN